MSSVKFAKSTTRIFGLMGRWSAAHATVVILSALAAKEIEQSMKRCAGIRTKISIVYYVRSGFAITILFINNSYTVFYDIFAARSYDKWVPGDLYTKLDGRGTS